MQLTSRPSGLLACHADADARSLERELQRFDPALFLTFEMEAGRQVWIVMRELSSDHVMPLCEWRDSNRTPLPLSSGLLELVRSLRPREGVDEDGGVRRVRAENERLREREQAANEEAVEDITREIGYRARDARRTILPRSPGLVASRRRQRARGESV